jgi:thiol peroxidase
MLLRLRNRVFGKKYGIEIVDGPLAGVLGRAIMVLDQQDTVIYTELVPEITREPNYVAAVEAVKA